MMRKLSPSQYVRTKWKNGRGETTQIAVSPPDATIDSFDWRISSAQVVGSDSFSTFSGIDRTLVVLSGAGMRLDVQSPDGERAVVLETQSPPYSFAGEWPVHADQLGTSAVVDFNVMTRRDRFAHSVSRLAVTEPMRMSARGLILYCISGRITCRDRDAPGARRLSLTAGDTLIVQTPPRHDANEEVDIWIDNGVTAAALLVCRLFLQGASGR